MYVVVEDCGKQYKAGEGDELELDLRDAAVGERIELDRVLLCSRQGEVRVGTPTLDGACVVAEVLGTKAGPKLEVYKYRKRKASYRKMGHRQKYTRVRVREIVTRGSDAAAGASAAGDEAGEA